MTDPHPATEPETTGRWRELLKDRGINIHPAAEFFPMMPSDELEVLAADIRRNGLREGVTLYTPHQREFGRCKPTDLYLLDGRNRLAAIELAFTDSESELAEQITWALNISSEDGDARLLYGNHDPGAFVISANAHRRHLTREQKRDFIEKLLAAHPERSDRATADLAKASHSTVAAIRAAAEGRGQIGHVPTRVDTMGRRQPARKTPVDAVKALPSLAKPTSSQEQPSPSSNEQQSLPRQPPSTTPLGTVGELLSLLQGDSSRITELPLEKRVIMVRGAMALFGVTLDDLQPIDTTIFDTRDNAALEMGLWKATSRPDNASHC